MSFMSLCLKKGHVHYVFMSKLKEACLLVLLLASLSSKRILNRWLTHLFFLILQSVNQYSSIYGRLSRGKLQELRREDEARRQSSCPRFCVKKKNGLEQ